MTRPSHCHGCSEVETVNAVGYCASCAGRTRKKPRDLTRSDRDYLREMAERSREMGGRHSVAGAA